MNMTSVGRLLCLASAIAVSGSASAAAGDLHTAGRTAGAPVLAYIVSQHYPQLTQAERTVISQDFNGAPLAGKPALHTVTAASVACRAKAASAGHAPPRGAISFGGPRAVRLGGEDGARLFEALGKAGAFESVATGRITRRLRDLNCTVDDVKAQSTPSSGDDIAGFACTFRTAP